MSDARFPQVASAPYPWPFDGPWLASNTAALLVNWSGEAVATLSAQAEAQTAIAVADAERRAGVLIVHVGAPLAAAQQAGDLAAPLKGGHAFFGTGLDGLLRERGVRNLIACGLPTEGLLHASVRAANDFGFECLTLGDACKGTRPDFHEAILRITRFGNGLFGVTAPAAALLAALRAPLAEISR